LRRFITAALWLIALPALLSVPRSSTDAFLRHAIVDPPFETLTYGIQVFAWWDHGFAGRDLDWVQRMVFSHVKQTFSWEDLQAESGGEFLTGRGYEVLNELERRNLKVIVRLGEAPAWSHPSVSGEKGVDYIDAPPDDLADFAAYCGKIATDFRGRIDGYQVWNEPNLHREWGGRPPDPAGYVGLLKVCSDAIRAADPDAVIISAGLSPTGTYDQTAMPDDMYLQGMYDAGFQQYVDVVGAHAPGWTEPERDPADAAGGNRFFSFRRVEDLRRIMIANGDAARQMAILEVGWTTDPANPDYAWFAVDEATQADYLVRAYAYAAAHWSPWVGLMSMIYIADPDWTEANEQYWWAITTPRGYTRPAYIELANMAKYCGDQTIPARAGDSPEALGLVPVYPCD
jgi:polysaccharide biosynthesis protein PslG